MQLTRHGIYCTLRDFITADPRESRKIKARPPLMPFPGGQAWAQEFAEPPKSPGKPRSGVQESRAKCSIYKNHGERSLFRENDRNRIQYAQRSAGPRIVVAITATRANESSYQYELQLTPEEIIRCLLTLPPQSPKRSAN
jgi:hypothetical protein